MTADSEFKQRIQIKINKQKSESSTPDDFSLNYIHKSYIDNLVDEAKDEWLIIQDFRYNHLGKDYISKEEAEQLWFKKWFGE